MPLTPLERRERIHRMLEKDPEYVKMVDEYKKAENLFSGFTNRLPRKWSSFLWTLPGMGYLLHHKMLNYICENMIFSDED